MTPFDDLMDTPKGDRNYAYTDKVLTKMWAYLRSKGAYHAEELLDPVDR